MSRLETIDGLRALADYLEQRPDVPLPYLGSLHAFPNASELQTVAKAMGGFTKTHDGAFLTLVKDFGAFRFHVNFASEAVCERVVVGTEDVAEKVVPAHTVEIVEWKCPESVLAFTSSGAES